MNIHAKIDKLLLEREFGKVNDLLTSELLTDPYYQLTHYKTNKLQELKINESLLIQPEQYSRILDELKGFNYQAGYPYLIDIEAQKYQLFSFVEIDDSNSMEQIIFDFELSYETFSYNMDFKDQLLRRMSYAETIYKLLQSPKQKSNYTFNLLKELLNWFIFFKQTYEVAKQQQDYFSILRKPLKELYRLSCIQILSELEKAQNFVQYIQILSEIIYDPLMTDDLRIAFLYSINKSIWSLIDQNTHQDQLQQVMGLVSKLCALQQAQTYLQIFEVVLFTLLSLVDKKKEHLLTKVIDSKKNKLELSFQDQLWFYVSINFTPLTIRLNNSIRNLISHNVFSMVNIYCTRFEKQTLQYKILEDLLITPFEDDILRMKMCVILFSTEDFMKLHQLVQLLLASDIIREHPFRPVIISLAVIFTGIYLGKCEESLCFARLNLQEGQGLLNQETLLAQVGYCYYNLGRTAKYLSEQTLFYSKALEYYEASIKINPQNHLIQYNMAKLLAVQGRIDDAVTHIQFAYQLYPGDVKCSILGALLYQVKQENSKALKIISQNIIDHPDKPLLHIVKAAILAEVYLTDLKNDKEFQYSKEMNLVDIVISKAQKQKEVQSILASLKKALCGIAKQVYEGEDHHFTAELVQLNTMQNFDVDPLTYINYRNCIFNTIDILINLNLFDIAKEVINLINDGNSTNQTERLFYEGLIAEKQNNIEHAITLYEEVLKQDFYHVRVMSKLGLLYLDTDKIQRAGELLITAQKFTKSYENCLGLGLLNQMQGLDSNDQFLEALQLLKQQPVLSFGLTFAFDSSVPQDEYEKYINPEDLLNESFEKVKGEFQAYRQKKGKDIIREEIEQRKQKKVIQRETPSREVNETRQLIGQITQKIRQQEQQCKQLKKRVMDPAFGEAGGQKFTIQKTEVLKQPIFSENDFQMLIAKDEEEDNERINDKPLPRQGFVNRIIQDKGVLNQRMYRTWVKLDEPKKTKHVRPALFQRKEPLNREEFIMNKAKKAFDIYDNMRKTSESLGVQPKEVIEFRTLTLKQAKIQSILQEMPTQRSRKESQFQDLKNNNMSMYLLNVMTKPIMDKKLIINKESRIHQQRLQEMKLKTKISSASLK